MVCVCVCVREREREREIKMERGRSWSGSLVKTRGENCKTNMSKVTGLSGSAHS